MPATEAEVVRWIAPWPLAARTSKFATTARRLAPRGQAGGDVRWHQPSEGVASLALMSPRYQ